MTEFIQNFIKGRWEARAETPEELAARFLRMIDAFKAIDPIFRFWACNYRRPRNFETLRDSFAREVAAKVAQDGSGNRYPEFGYRFGAYTRDAPEGGSFIIECKAGATAQNAFPNDVTMATFGRNPDPEIVDYRLMRSALLAIVDAWEPVKAAAFSNQLFVRSREANYFREAWIQYLCPRLAEKITPPSTVLSEHLPNGGLLMTATTETFDVDNPAHLKAAQDMAAAMAPLDLLPWPSQRA